MPYANPEDKKRWIKHWKKESKVNGYNKWLYARRKVRTDDASAFRETLEKIARLDGTAHPDWAMRLARQVLAESRERWEALGDPPHRVRSDVKMDGLENPPEVNGPADNSLLSWVANMK